MKYTVLWEKSAENQLMRIWTHAPDQQDVADASNRIERDLAYDAPTKGTSIGVFRKYTGDPLAVLIYVDPGDCKVHIISVRRSK
jgi:hypothetical protein